MENQYVKDFEDRVKRNSTVLSLNEPDRVPFMPSMMNFYPLHYGLSIEDAMTDIRSLIAPLGKFCDEYDPDWVWNSMPFPKSPMEILGYCQARWPGNYWGLPKNTPYQYLDKSFLDEDDYPKFISDPTGFILKEILPKKYSALKGLEMLSPYSNCSQAIVSFSSFALPPVQTALMALAEAGRELGKYTEGSIELTKSIIEKGYPVYASFAATTAFDDFADNIRGIMEFCTDILTIPDDVEAALEKWNTVSIPQAIDMCKKMQLNNLLIPLHCGVDDFMSLENYEKFYWPSLKKLILAAVKEDITPIVFCEGKYNSRLECLTDVPKGKVIYNFENVDFKEAKKIIGPYAAIMGGMDTDTLMFGSPESVEQKTREMLDILAPGGGYFMSNSLALDDVPRTNMMAWRNALEKYGHY